MKLYLDDVRSTPAGWTRAYTAKEAIAYLETGKVTDISFDHDLGPEEAGTGYQVANWIEEQAYLGKLPPLGWGVHSANPVGYQNISRAMESAERFWLGVK